MTRTRANNVSSSNKNTGAFGEFFRTLGAMTQIMKDNMPAPSTPAPNLADSELIERFKRLAPPTFLGHGGVEKAEKWKRQVEKFLEVLQCSDEQKVRQGAFMLEWTEATWDNFLVAFDEKYFPESVRERKEVEFIELQQWRLTIQQYAIKFVDLSRYAPHIINTEVRKASIFERGLRLDIRGRVLSANIKLYAPLVDLVMNIERDCEKFRMRKEGRPRPAQSGNIGKKVRPPSKKDFRGRPYPGNRRAQKTFPSNKGDNLDPTFSYCGWSNHTEAECYKKLNMCLKCGKPDHWNRDCPMIMLENRPKTQDRVFALTE
ncbi:uncharacterized protein LOC105421481 [Amborella trichopoda]|uniref:uncharacterized protein LOC105421481 n=1 Tax=Amborella trichopoda TaxID=13333 RepID=UPI0009C0D306|nr:uncharacterized protein LOC105421481 [Amborella trichopoda]|eukprot:XP_020529553.1 uncharacterized protein LOC105421481 [Amborella trichopoda]